jgi:hypothetical protein
MSLDNAGISGEFIYRLIDRHGNVKQYGHIKNLITDYGDQWAASRTANVSVQGAITGMRLGTGTTSPAKSGAGAAIVTYVSGSARVLDANPSLSDQGSGSGHDAVYVVTWPDGVVTQNNISEVVVTNEDPVTNVAGTAGNTIARGLLSPVVNKGADDTLQVTWRNRYNGS